MSITIIVDPCTDRSIAFANRLIGELLRTIRRDVRMLETSTLFISSLSECLKSRQLREVDPSSLADHQEWIARAQLMQVPELLQAIDELFPDIAQLPAYDRRIRPLVLLISDGRTNHHRIPRHAQPTSAIQKRKQEQLRLLRGVKDAAKRPELIRRLQEAHESEAQWESEIELLRDRALMALHSNDSRLRQAHELKRLNCLGLVLGSTYDSPIWHPCPWVISVGEAAEANPEELASGLGRIHQHGLSGNRLPDRWDVLRMARIPFAAIQQSPERLLAEVD
jgi:hypothetical protein